MFPFVFLFVFLLLALIAFISEGTKTSNDASYALKTSLYATTMQHNQTTNTPLSI